MSTVELTTKPGLNKEQQWRRLEAWNWSDDFLDTIVMPSVRTPGGKGGWSVFSGVVFRTTKHVLVTAGLYKRKQ